MVNFIENITWILCITDVKCFNKIKLKQQQIGACCCSHSCVFSYIYSLWLWCCRPLTQREMALLSAGVVEWVLFLCVSLLHIGFGIGTWWWERAVSDLQESFAVWKSVWTALFMHCLWFQVLFHSRARILEEKLRF